MSWVGREIETSVLVWAVKSGSVSETTDYCVMQVEVHSFERGGNVYDLHGDALGPAQMVTNSSGTEVASLVHGAWGDVLDETESISRSRGVSRRQSGVNPEFIPANKIIRRGR